MRALDQAGEWEMFVKRGISGWQYDCAWGCSDYGYPTSEAAARAFLEHECLS